MTALHIVRPVETRRGFHTFTAAAPVFGQAEDDFDPFYQADRAASRSLPRQSLPVSPFRQAPELQPERNDA